MIEPEEIAVLEHLAASQGYGDVPDVLRFHARQMCEKGWLTNAGTTHASRFLMSQTSWDLLSAIRVRQAKPRIGRPENREKPADVKIIAALCRWHDYQSGGKASKSSVLNHEPASLKHLEKLAGVSTKSISIFLKRKFDGKEKAEGYDAECRKEQIGFYLTVWRGELSTQDIEAMVDVAEDRRRRKREED